LSREQSASAKARRQTRGLGAGWLRSASLPAVRRLRSRERCSFVLPRADSHLSIASCSPMEKSEGLF